MNENFKCPYCDKELIHIKYMIEEIVDYLKLLLQSDGDKSDWARWIDNFTIELEKKIN